MRAAILLLLPLAALAAPFLTSDPYPAGEPQPERFEITLANSRGVEKIEVPATKNPDGSVYLQLDLVGRPALAFSLKAMAINREAASDFTPDHFIYHWLTPGGERWVFAPIQVFEGSR